MLKDLSEKERKTHRQIEIALMYSNTNRIANANAAQDWRRFRKEQHQRAVDQHMAGTVTVRDQVLKVTKESK